MILSLEFLGPYAAADVTRRDTPEWPPHPDRVYQSLVDAAQLTDDAEVNALRWLEAQAPPGLAVPDAVPMLPAESFVPVNYPDSGLDLDARSKQPRSFPMIWPKGTVSMVWPDPTPEMLETLRRIGARVTHVGRAESHVLASVKAGSMATPLVPHRDGSLSLRVPTAGRFDALEAAFRSGRFAPQASSASYVLGNSVIGRGPWSELITVKLRHPLSAVKVVDAADALRRAVLSRLGDDAPPSVHGHADRGPSPTGTHVVWLGLPNLSPFSRGELIGLGIALPRDMPPGERARCLQALLSVDHIIASGRRVEVEPPSRALSLEADRWMRPSRLWRSVTPTVLDRFPKRGKLTAEDIVIEGLVSAGYPEPAKVRLIPVGALGDTLPSAAFRLRRPGRLYSHVEITFASAVRGPLVVGAERHFGLGLCLPEGR